MSRWFAPTAGPPSQLGTDGHPGQFTLKRQRRWIGARAIDFVRLSVDLSGRLGDTNRRQVCSRLTHVPNIENVVSIVHCGEPESIAQLLNNIRRERS